MQMEAKEHRRGDQKVIQKHDSKSRLLPYGDFASLNGPLTVLVGAQACEGGGGGGDDPHKILKKKKNCFRLQTKLSTDFSKIRFLHACQHTPLAIQNFLHTNLRLWQTYTDDTTHTTHTYLFLRVVQREAASAGEVRADRMVVHHHRERPVNGNVWVHQTAELLRVVVSLVPRDDEGPIQATTVTLDKKQMGTEVNSSQQSQTATAALAGAKRSQVGMCITASCTYNLPCNRSLA